MSATIQDYLSLEAEKKQQWLTTLCEESLEHWAIFVQLHELLQLPVHYDEYSLDSLYRSLVILLDESKQAQHKQIEAKIMLIKEMMEQGDEDEWDMDEEEWEDISEDDE